MPIIVDTIEQAMMIQRKNAALQMEHWNPFQWLQASNILKNIWLLLMIQDLLYEKPLNMMPG